MPERCRSAVCTAMSERKNIMEDKQVVLCGASAYEQKYYFNQAFAQLPRSIQDELRIICVLFTEEIGGVLTLSFDEEGNLQFTTEAKESDYMYDDIGSGLMIKEIQKSRRELLEELELFYKVIFLKQKVEF